MKTVKTIGNVYSIILIVVLAILALVMIVPKIMGYDEYAMAKKSMEPTIKAGAMVFDKKVDLEKLEVGDIITYEVSEDELLTHRITAIDAEKKTVTTKGDANNAEDASLVAYNNILGKYEFNIPFLGYIFLFAQSVAGIVVICALLLLWLVRSKTAFSCASVIFVKSVPLGKKKRSSPFTFSLLPRCQGACASAK